MPRFQVTLIFAFGCLVIFSFVHMFVCLYQSAHIFFSSISTLLYLSDLCLPDGAKAAEEGQQEDSQWNWVRVSNHFVFVKIAAMGQSKIKSNRYNNGTSFQLTLLGPEGGLCPPCRLFAYNRANTRTSVLKKLDFEFGKGHYAFYPMKLSRLGKKK